MQQLPQKCILDSVFGVVVFNEVTTDVKWGVKSGTITRTVIATNPGEDYSFLYT